MLEMLSDPERELASSYAPRSARDRLRTLWRVDEKFGAIVSATTEPTIGEMRLLWWREALETSSAEPRQEPLLEAVRETLAQSGSEGAEWGAMAEGWHALLQQPLGTEDLARFAEERGSRLFRLSAELLAGEIPSWMAEEGKAWALVDLSCRITDARVRAMAKSMAREVFEVIGRSRWPRDLRALGALAMLARRDTLTENRHQGSPGRVARMAWHRMTGR